MQELWLNFSDGDGVTRRVRVDGERCIIGRQPDCDLAISDSRLSRQHAAIERFGGRYEIADLGSSNGTEVRGSQVFDAAPIYDGDTISLGGLTVKAEIKEAVQAAAAASAAPIIAASTAAIKSNKPKEEKKGGIPLALLLAAPILAVVLVLVAGGVVYLVIARGSGEVTANPDDTDDPLTISKKDDGPATKKDDDTPTSSSPNTPGSATTDTPSNGTTTADVKPVNNSESAKIETHGANFMRKIAGSDPNIFLTGEQSQKLGAKVKQLSGSSAIADNIKSAQKNAAAISKLAKDNSMKPQFLAVAAIAKLGSTRGDVLATASSMTQTLVALSRHIGSEFSDDCLLTIAAYDQGAAGDTMKMRNMLQQLVRDVPDSVRTVRTIWYLQKNGKITQAEYDRALTFLAIGTIAQNPKDFNVNAQALDL